MNARPALFAAHSRVMILAYHFHRNRFITETYENSTRLFRTLTLCKGRKWDTLYKQTKWTNKRNTQKTRGYADIRKCPLQMNKSNVYTNNWHKLTFHWSETERWRFFIFITFIIFSLFLFSLLLNLHTFFATMFKICFCVVSPLTWLKFFVNCRSLANSFLI